MYYSLNPIICSTLHNAKIIAMATTYERIEYRPSSRALALPTLSKIDPRKISWESCKTFVTFLFVKMSQNCIQEISFNSETCGSTNMFLPSNIPLRSCNFLIIFAGTLLFQIITLVPTFAQDNTPTVLGAVSDKPPLEVRVGVDRYVRVYNAARNRLIEKRGVHHWADMAYFYEGSWEIVRDATGNPQVHGPYEIDADRATLIFSLRMKPEEKNILAGEIRKHWNAHALEVHIQPLFVFDIKVSVTGAGTFRQRAENGKSLREPIHVELEVPRNRAPSIIQRIRDGAALITLRHKTLVNASQVQELIVRWKHVTKTKTYQDYFGPSGPDYITAAQTVERTAAILEELDAFSWGEGTDGQYGELFVRLLSSLINLEPVKVSLEKLTDPRSFTVDVMDLVAMRDVITKIAEDAKNLNHQEWCRKYKNTVNEMIEGGSSSSKETQFGLEILIKKFPIKFGFGQKGNRSNVYKKNYAYLREEQNCGKSIVENQFSYEWEGEKYIPKSITLYQNIRTDSSGRRDTLISRYSIALKYGVTDVSIPTN